MPRAFHRDKKELPGYPLSDGFNYKTTSNPLVYSSNTTNDIYTPMTTSIGTSNTTYTYANLLNLEQ